MGNIFRDVKNALDDKKEVLFSGCPCQIAGLKSFLGRDYDNLYLVDLLCGNSPSETFFKSYIEEEFGDDIKSYEFRHKEATWRADCEKINIKSGECHIRTGIENDAYQSVYHDHTMCPPHCENCMFHSIPRYGDLSIGDFWGISKYKTDLDTSLGVSVILVNNDKGDRLLSSISKNDIALLEQIPIDWIGGNGYLNKNSSNFISPFRDLFYKEFLKNGFHAAVKAVDRDRVTYTKRRYMGDFNILRDWLALKQKGINIAENIMQSGYKRIAIYGMGDMGKLLFDELSSQDMKVEYIIDRNPRIGYKDALVYGLNVDKYPDVDAIIVTVVWDMDNVIKKLDGKTTSKIVPISDVLAVN